MENKTKNNSDMRRVKVYHKGIESTVDFEGYFHGWGCDYQEFESGPENSTIAVVERLDGKIKTVPPEWVTFVNDHDEPREERSEVSKRCGNCCFWDELAVGSYGHCSSTLASMGMKAQIHGHEPLTDFSFGCICWAEKFNKNETEVKLIDQFSER